MSTRPRTASPRRQRQRRRLVRLAGPVLRADEPGQRDVDLAGRRPLGRWSTDDAIVQRRLGVPVPRLRQRQHHFRPQRPREWQRGRGHRTRDGTMRRGLRDRGQHPPLSVLLPAGTRLRPQLRGLDRPEAGPHQLRRVRRQQCHERPGPGHPDRRSEHHQDHQPHPPALHRHRRQAERRGVPARALDQPCRRRLWQTHQDPGVHRRHLEHDHGRRGALHAQGQLRRDRARPPGRRPPQGRLAIRLGQHRLPVRHERGLRQHRREDEPEGSGPDRSSPAPTWRPTSPATAAPIPAAPTS